jgi:hypothetical protein
MKNQYFGDVNDYLKYGFLRCFAEAGLSIGVCWMLTPDDNLPDGRKIEYLLSPQQWRRHDPRLFDALSNVITKRRQRHVRHIQKKNLLPNTQFFDDLVPDGQSSREEWLTKALTKFTGIDLLFFDPDNGIEVKSKGMGRRGSNKYVFWREIQVAWSCGSSLLIFQHFPRENRRQYIWRIVSQLTQEVPAGSVVPLITSNVVYFLVYRECHKPNVLVALKLITNSWSGQISLAECEVEKRTL